MLIYLFVFRWGRRRPLIAFHVVAGVALILTQVVPASIGKTNNGFLFAPAHHISLVRTFGLASVLLCQCACMNFILKAFSRHFLLQIRNR